MFLRVFWACLQFGALAASVGCSEVTNVERFPSLNGEWVILVAQERQGANDPAPWWTNVSLRKSLDKEREIPGNVAVLQGQGEIQVRWKTPKAVELSISSDFKSGNPLPKSVELHGVNIQFSWLHAVPR